jgi:carboxylesterase type B
MEDFCSGFGVSEPLPEQHSEAFRRVCHESKPAAGALDQRDNATEGGSISDSWFYGFAPVVDGKILPQHPFDPAASRVSADVPVMIGCTRTEETLFALNDPAAFSLDENGLQTRVETLVHDEAQPMIDLYRRLNPGGTPSDIYFLIAGDYRYCAPTMKVAGSRATLAKGPVYLYHFRWETPCVGRFQPASLDAHDCGSRIRPGRCRIFRCGR